MLASCPSGFLAAYFAPVPAGSDSSGYFNGARLLLQGRLATPPRAIGGFAASSPWIYTPHGFTPEGRQPGLTPTYPLGLSLHYALAAKLAGWTWGPTLVAVLAAVTVAPAAQPVASDVAFYEQTVKPILAGACFECHSHETKKFKGGLALDSAAAIHKGGDTGPAIVPGDAEKSLLIKAVRYTDPDLQMPPKNKQLGSDQIAALEKWVKLGAPMPEAAAEAQAVRRGKITDEDRQWWAFVPVRKPAVPGLEKVISKGGISGPSATGQSGKSARSTSPLITNHSSPENVDPENLLLSRFPYRRLEVEAIRDSMLAVSGRLNPRLGGPSMYPEVPKEASGMGSHQSFAFTGLGLLV